MEILSPGATILTVTERGYGKRTPLDDYRLQKRGGQGVITIRTTERNGQVVGVAQVVDDDELMLITDGGKVLRCPVSGISTMGRATQGVRVMDLAPDENLISIARLAEADIVAPEAAAGDDAPDDAADDTPDESAGLDAGGDDETGSET
jgi:DNA gyrase subunit A